MLFVVKFVMTIIESLERTLFSLSPFIKCPIKRCVNVFQRDMFLILFILELLLMDIDGSGCVNR